MRRGTRRIGLVGIPPAIDGLCKLSPSYDPGNDGLCKLSLSTDLHLCAQPVVVIFALDHGLLPEGNPPEQSFL